MRLSIRLTLLLVLSVFCFPLDQAGAGTDPGLRSIGVRAGLSATGMDNYFHQYEAAAVFQLPWELRNRSGWGISTQLDSAAGVLHDEGRTGFIVSAGPSFRFGKAGFPLQADLGFSPAIITRDTFGNRDYNGNVQFISHVGLDLRPGSRVGVGYRFQHMSNAGLNGGSNPGLNMHLLEVNWYFRP